MAASIGDVKITIAADGSQVGPAFQQAQRHFRQFQNETATGMRQVGGIAQQAVFAVDDFVASFSTGGVAGGIRGAANNLTMIASMLGGIKVQLAAIGVIAIGQLLASQFGKASKAIDAASESLTRFQEQLKRNSSIGQRANTEREKIRELLGEDSLPNAFNSLRSGRTKLSDLQDQLDAERKRIADLRQTAASVVGDEATKAVRDELAEREKNARTIREEIREQERLNEAAKRQVDILQRRRMEGFTVGAAGGIGGGMGRFAQAAGLDAQIAELRQSMVHSFGIAELFSRFPQANAMGSVGAVSTLNAAQFGPQNMQNTLVREAQETNRVLKRIEELEKKKASLEVVPIP